MAAEVPWKRTEPQYTEARAGAPVRGRTYRELATLLHWARAHGMQVVPAHRPGSILTSSDVLTLRYRVQPQGLAIARLWHIVLRQEDPADPPTAARVEVTYPDAVVVRYDPALLLGMGAAGSGRIYIEDLSAKSAALATLTLTIEHVTGTSPVTVESISCCEVPRALLALDGTDLGVDLETLRPGEPIYDGTRASITDLAEAWASTAPRRALAAWSGTAIDVSAGSFTDLLVLPAPVLARKGSRTATTREITVYVYAVTTSTTAEVRVTAASGDTATTTISGAAAWYALTLDIDCEDVTAADGLQGATWETLQIASRIASGAGTVSVSSWAALETS